MKICRTSALSLQTVDGQVVVFWRWMEAARFSKTWVSYLLHDVTT